MKYSLAFIATLASGFVLSAAAQTAPAPAAAPVDPHKIAIVFFQDAVGNTNEFQGKLAELKKKYEPKSKQLQAENDEIDNLTKQLKAEGDKLSEAERTSRTKSIDEKKKKLQQDAQAAQSAFQPDVQDTFSDVAKKVEEVLTSYAQQQGYALVLDRSQRQSNVLFASDAIDITKQITDAYNVKSGVAAPAPPAEVKPAAPAPKP
jgi:outer membrane protein